MKIVGIFNSNEDSVGYRLAGIKTYVTRQENDLIKVLKEVREDLDVQYYCV